MINSRMRLYDFYKYDTLDAYGQYVAADEAAGKVKMAISTTSTQIQDNINYKDANYIGLTFSSLLDDKTIIDYNGTKLKVLYVNPEGRLNQVFLAEL